MPFHMPRRAVLNAAASAIGTTVGVAGIVGVTVGLLIFEAVPKGKWSRQQSLHTCQEELQATQNVLKAISNELQGVCGDDGCLSQGLGLAEQARQLVDTKQGLSQRVEDLQDLLNRVQHELAHMPVAGNDTQGILRLDAQVRQFVMMYQEVTTEMAALVGATARLKAAHAAEVTALEQRLSSALLQLDQAALDRQEVAALLTQAQETARVAQDEKAESEAKHEENMHALQQQIRRSKDEADRLASENQAHIALLTEGQRQAQHLHEEEIRLQATQHLDLGVKLQAAIDQQVATQVALTAAETAKQGLRQRLVQHQEASQRLQREWQDERQATVDGRLADQQERTDLVEKLSQMQMTLEQLQSGQIAKAQHDAESHYLLQADLSHQQDLVRKLQQQLINQKVSHAAEIVANAEQQRSDAQQVQQQLKDVTTRATAAVSARDKAASAMQNAEKGRRSAERAVEEAVKGRLSAEDALKEAVEGRLSAEDALKEAVKGRQDANDAKQWAAVAVKAAESAKEKADSAQAKAEAARQEAQTELRALQGRHSAELCSNNQLQAKMNKLSKELAVATAEATSSNTAVERADAELKSSQSEVAHLQRLLNEVSQQHHQLEWKQQAALKEMQRLRATHGRLRSDHDRTANVQLADRQAYDWLQQQNRQLVASTADLAVKSKQDDTNLQDLSAKFGDLQRQYAELEEQHKELTRSHRKSSSFEHDMPGMQKPQRQAQLLEFGSISADESLVELLRSAKASGRQAPADQPDQPIRAAATAQAAASARQGSQRTAQQPSSAAPYQPHLAHNMSSALQQPRAQEQQQQQHQTAQMQQPMVRVQPRAQVQPPPAQQPSSAAPYQPHLARNMPSAQVQPMPQVQQPMPRVQQPGPQLQQSSVQLSPSPAQPRGQGRQLVPRRRQGLDKTPALFGRQQPQHAPPRAAVGRSTAQQGPHRQAAPGPQLASHAVVAPREARPAGGTKPAGMRNDRGQYHCFLNSSVQALRHCPSVLAHLKALPSQRYQGNHLIKKFVGLVQELERHEKQRIEEPVDPMPLRQALSSKYPLRAMADAGELLADFWEDSGMLKRAFAAVGHNPVENLLKHNIKAGLHCSECNQESRLFQHQECVFNVTAHELASVQEAKGPHSLGLMLQYIADAAEQHSCGYCRAQNRMSRALEGPPPGVFAVQLAWQYNMPEDEVKQAIAATCAGLTEELALQDVFQGLGPDVKRYHACSMICFFQGHHTAFVLKDGCWISFDDALSSHVGSWQEVVKKCKDGKMKPVYILYDQEQN